MAYQDGRSTRPPPLETASSSIASSSYIPPLPRPSELVAGLDSYSSSSSGGGGGGGGGPGNGVAGGSGTSAYSGGASYHSYPSSHQHGQQRSSQPHLPPPHQHQQQQQQPSYPRSHASPSHPHQHPHSSYHQPHNPHPPPPPPSSSMSYTSGYDSYDQFPLFPYGYPSQGTHGTSTNLNVSGSAGGQGQESNGINGAHHHSQPAHHPSTGSSNNYGGNTSGEDSSKFAFSYYGSSSNSGAGQGSSSSGLSGCAQGSSSGQDQQTTSVTVAPLPSHIEAEIMSTSTWLLHPGDLPLGLNPNRAGSPTGQRSAPLSATAENSQRSPNSNLVSSSASPQTQSSVQQQQQQQQSSSQPSNQPSSNNLGPSPADDKQPAMTSHLTPPSATTSAPPAPLPLPAVMPPIAPPTEALFLGLPQEGWRLAVEPLTFASGLEGISGLPLDVFHATTSMGEIPSQPLALDMPRPDNSLAHDEEVHRLDGYLADLIMLMEPFAPSPSNPSPNPPPPFLHTRITRLATLVRESLKILEPRSQPLLDAEFMLAPPGIEISEADREMEAIRRRRDILNQKAKNSKNELAGTTVPRRPGGPPGLNVGTMSATRQFPPGLAAARLPREAWRCSGCGTTASNEWRDGPDGPQSLCENCGYHYERILRKRLDGDLDFSSVVALGHNPNLIGMGPS